MGELVWPAVPSSEPEALSSELELDLSVPTELSSEPTELSSEPTELSSVELDLSELTELTSTVPEPTVPEPMVPEPTVSPDCGTATSAVPVSPDTDSPSSRRPKPPLLTDPISYQGHFLLLN